MGVISEKPINNVPENILSTIGYKSFTNSLVASNLRESNQSKKSVDVNSPVNITAVSKLPVMINGKITIGAKPLESVNKLGICLTLVSFVFLLENYPFYST